MGVEVNESTSSMTDRTRPTSRKRKKTVRRAKKTAEPPATSPGPVPAKRDTGRATEATQVDIAEVSGGPPPSGSGDSVKAKKSDRRRPKRTKKTPRRKRGSGKSAASGNVAESAPATEQPQPPRDSAPPATGTERTREPETHGSGSRGDEAQDGDQARDVRQKRRAPRSRKRKSARSGSRQSRSESTETDTLSPTSVETDSTEPGFLEETVVDEADSRRRDASDAERRAGPAPTAASEVEGASTDSGTSRVADHPKKSGRGRRAKSQRKDTTTRAPAGDKSTKRHREETDQAPADEDDDESATPGSGSREMLINVSAGDECRIAILHEGRLEELFIERSSTQSHVGNIYKARITNVEPSIQAAFIDFGLPQNGFLHISDVQPQYFPDHKGEIEEVGRKIPRHNRPPIQRCFRRGQEVIVQVTKEGVGTKGPTLTTYLSLPGRFLVMMPGMHRHGVSRKIEDDSDRRSMRDMLDQLELPSDMGFIMRTAGLGRTKRELQRDLQYLTRLWKAVSERVKQSTSPAELYQESDLVTRTIRDVYTADFKRLVVDDADTAKTAREFLQIAMPRSKAPVDLYTDREPLFHRYRIEEEIEKINMRHVPLPSGGSLVIDSTEALVAIDVNSGRFRTIDDAEETAFRINIEAAEEIARQLRLRDLGGLIVCDFIDMRLDRHQRAVERALRDAVKKHKERARITKMSAFGLIEMTRQRQGPSLKRNIYFDCPHCQGTGQVKMPDSVILDVMRIIQLAAHRDTVQRVIVTVSNDVAYRILNNKRNILNQIETETGKEIVVRGNAQFVSDQVECICEDTRGRPVNVLPANAKPDIPQKKHRR